MNKKTLTIILSLILLICFFLPYLSNASENLSGLNVVFGKKEIMGLSNSGGSLFVCLLIPIGALMILIGTLTNDNFTSGGFVRWIPLVGVAYIIVMLYMQAEENIGAGEFISYFGYGLWITLVAALILPFTRSSV